MKQVSNETNRLITLSETPIVSQLGSNSKQKKISSLPKRLDTTLQPTGTGGGEFADAVKNSARIEYGKTGMPLYIREMLTKRWEIWCQKY